MIQIFLQISFLLFQRTHLFLIGLNRQLIHINPLLQVPNRPLIPLLHLHPITNRLLQLILQLLNLNS